MSDTILEHDDLTPDQEYSIAAGVILFFGLLYWIFNYGLPNFGAYSGAAPAPVILDADATLTARPERLALNDVPASSADSSAKSTASTPKNPTEKTTAVAETTGNEQQMLAGSDGAENTGEEQLQVAAADSTNDAGQQSMAAEDKPVEANVGTEQTEQQVADPATDDGPEQVAQVKQESQPEAASAKKVVIMDAAVAKLQDHLAKGEMEKPVVMESITFASGSSQLDLKSDHQIEAIAGLLGQHPGTRLLIRGHTDSAGPDSENKELSLMRARAMGQKLVEAGVDSESIIIMGMGSAEPLSGSNTQQVRGQDRRIDVSITR